MSFKFLLSNLSLLLSSSSFQMFGFSKKDPGRNSFMGKCATVVGGLYLFFILEYIMKLYVQFKALNKQVI